MQGLSLLSFIFLLLTVLLSVNCQTTNSFQKNALIALNQATNGQNWSPNKWDLSTDPCEDSWYGVQCNNGNVYTVSVQSNNLSGYLPSNISDLGSLQFLYLSKNSISGIIPPEIGKLTQLQQLGLDENEFIGSIPDLSNLQSLQNLFLQNNKLNGTLDTIGTLKNLVYFYISNNMVSGTISEAIGDLFYLQQIGIDQNKLTGTVPSGFGSKQNYLQSFYIQNNDLTGSFPTVQSLCSIENCYAEGNHFSCPITPQDCCGVKNCY